MKKIAFQLTFILLAFFSKAQINMTNTTMSTYSVCGQHFYDSGGSAGSYTNSANSTHYVYSVPSITSTVNSNKFKITVNSCLISPGDTLFIYSTARDFIPENTEKLITKLTGTITGTSYLSRSSGIVFKFKSDGTGVDQGWDITLDCLTPQITTVSNSTFTKGGNYTVGISGTNTLFIENSPSKSVFISNGTYTVNGTSISAVNDSLLNVNFSIPCNQASFSYSIITSGFGQGILSKSSAITILDATTNVVATNPACAGSCNGSANLTHSGFTSPVTFSWTPGGQSTSSVSGLCAGIYSVTLTDANGCSSVKSVVVSQPPALNITTSSNQTICANSTAPISVNASGGTPPYIYNWSPNGTVNTSTLASTNAFPLSTTAYSINVTDANSCVTTGVTVVTVQQSPSVSSSVSGTLSCLNSTVNVAATTTVSPVTYNWSGPSIVSGGTAPNPTVNGPGIYSYSVTTALGCLTSGSVSVSQQISTPTLAVSASSSTLCSGQSATLSVSGANQYLWFDSSTATSVVVTPTASTTYSVSGTNTLTGCSSNYSIAIIISAPPTLTISPSAISICNSATATITASGASTYLWNTSETTSSISVSPTVTTSYTVTGTNGTCSNTKTITVTVNALPNIAVNSGTICAGQSYTMVPSGASTYTYSGGSAIVTPTTTTSYSVTGTSVAGCVSATQISTVTVNPSPTIAVNNGTICSGQSFTMTPSGASTYTYSSGSAIITPSTTTSYSITGADANGCTATEISTVTVNALPLITITPSSSSICNSGTATLTAAGANTYTWSTAQNNASISVTPTLTTTYSVTGTNTLGCVNSATAQINNIPSKNITGIASSTTGAVNGDVTLYKYSPILSKWDSVATITFNPNFTFTTLDSGQYVLKAKPSAANIQTTYGNSSISWQNATIINHGCAANTNQTITLIPLANIGTGAGSMSGLILEGDSFGLRLANQSSAMAPLAPGSPIGGITVKGGKNPGGNMFAQTETNSAGGFTLTGIPNTVAGESIFILIDIAGLDTAGTYYRSFSNGESYTELNFIVDSAKIRPVTQATVDVGIVEKNKNTNVNLELFPNPANDYVVIKYTLTQNTDVKINVIDMLGKNSVDTIIESNKNSGMYSYTLNLKEFKAGIYFISLTVNDKKVNKKLIIYK